MHQRCARGRFSRARRAGQSAPERSAHLAPGPALGNRRARVKRALLNDLLSKATVSLLYPTAGCRYTALLKWPSPNPSTRGRCLAKASIGAGSCRRSAGRPGRWRVTKATCTACRTQRCCLASHDAGSGAFVEDRGHASDAGRGAALRGGRAGASAEQARTSRRSSTIGRRCRKPRRRCRRARSAWTCCSGCTRPCWKACAGGTRLPGEYPPRAGVDRGAQQADRAERVSSRRNRSRVPKLMPNVEAIGAGDELDPLVQLALIHAQFGDNSSFP